jgi:lipopolysaccharide transport system permease protein
MWASRGLLYFLVWRDIKIRYKQTAMGVAWAVLQPVVTTAIFTVLFSSWARFDTKDVPYPLFALSGLMLWLFTHTAITIASNSFVNNVNLVTKIYFPRLLVPIAATLASVFDLVFGLVLLALLMAYYSVIPSTTLLWSPLFVSLAVVQAAAIGTLLSAVNVRFRDVKFALPFFLQVWMIASPVFYPASMISPKWRLVFAVNPLTGIIEGFRSSVFGTAIDWQIVLISGASTALLLLISLVVFRWMEDSFADLV